MVVCRRTHQLTALFAVVLLWWLNATNNLGLWAVDSTGVLRRLLSDGDSMTVGGVSKRLKTFRALTPSTSLGGVASGYDNTGDVSVLATFTDRSAALVNVPVP
jgi:hypothetical protein